LAKVAPIYEKGNKNQNENWRPISKQNVISKAFARLDRYDLALTA
jgi:hypothetical protein